MSTTTTTSIPITLKWSKQTFAMDLDPSLSALQWKEEIQSLTGVPTTRQKLLCTSLWKGMLSDDYPLSQLLDKINTNNKRKKKIFIVTLIGSAETLADNNKPGLFVEDLTPEQQQEQQASHYDVSMIPALQKQPNERNDGKTELYAYNHYVTGLPQAHIEQLIKDQADATTTDNDDKDQETNDGEQDSDKQPPSKSRIQLAGRVAMNLGLELRRSYINDLSVLPNGGLLSALDDGHIQLWKHGVLQDDIIHEGNKNYGGVDSLAVLTATTTNSTDTDSSNNNQWPDVASAGRGYLHFWSHDKDDDTLQRVAALPASPVPGQTSPTSLVQVPTTSNGATNNRLILAARYNVKEPPPSGSGMLRLAAQTEDQRQRQARAQAQDQMIRGTLNRVAKSIQVWYTTNGNGNSANTNPASFLQTKVLEPHDNNNASTLMSLVALGRGSESSWLISGDVAGGLRIWNVSEDSNQNQELVFREQAYFQLQPLSGGCSISCLHTLPDGRLAVSTDDTATTPTTHSSGDGCDVVSVPLSQAVYILSFQQENNNMKTTLSVDAILNGHLDTVTCLMGLSNGDLMTAGGKHDATLQIWRASQLGKSADAISHPDNAEDAIMEDADTSTEPQGIMLPSTVQTQSHQTITTNQGSTEKIGYVFALALLTDQQEGSHHFAVATARYNQVKILL